MVSYLQTNDTASKPVTISVLRDLHKQGEKIAMLTCYEASFASLMDSCGVEVLLVGDSLGMVCQGHSSTLPVSIQDVIYHTQSVARGNTNALVLTDLPFGSYATPESAFINAAPVIQAGAQMVKMEGGAWLASTVRFLTERSIPVCGHLGLMPQSMHQMGGYKVQGKTLTAAAQLKEDALILQESGASLLVLEAIPASLAKEISNILTIPTIGIGAGPDCSGQVLVLHDLLGIFPGRKARFVKNFMQGQASIDGAICAYVRAVKENTFPALEHCF